MRTFNSSLLRRSNVSARIQKQLMTRLQPISPSRVSQSMYCTPTDGGTADHGCEGLMILHYSIPKLSTGSFLKPYVRQHNELAVIDTARVTGPMTNINYQSLASEQTAWKFKKVCTQFPVSIFLFYFFFCYEENSTIA